MPNHRPTGPRFERPRPVFWGRTDRTRIRVTHIITTRIVVKMRVPYASTARGRPMTMNTSEEVLRAVAHGRRRQILEWLRHNGDGEASIEELADGLRGRDAPSIDSVVGGIGVQNARSTEDGDRLRISVHHVHLPKLTEHGLVDYDPVDGTVQYRADERVERLLDVLDEELPKVSV